MKIIALILMVSQISFATTPSAEAPPAAPSTTTMERTDHDVTGTIVPPTPKQKKYVNNAAKKAQKKVDCKKTPEAAECKQH